jgi:acyl-CoA synthetase (AMP-forming)/AMP-acid ligase II
VPNSLLATSPNVGARLTITAQQMPDEIAVVTPGERGNYWTWTFRDLDEDSNRIAAALVAMGVAPGSRIVLLVRPGFDFISLTFALFKAGAVTVLIDPGMGRKSLLRCLTEVEPDGFIAISLGHAVRTMLSHRFPKARYNVTVGRRWFWDGPTLAELRSRGSPDFTAADVAEDDPAAIIFTTGSTGPPKGVRYRHGNFSRQVDELREFYGIQPGEIDLPGFPLFALFNCAMGVTTVVPDMDPTRPARADPRKIVRAIDDWSVTQAFGSPALWNVVGRYCEDAGVKLPMLRRVLSAGAPVPPHVLRRMKEAIHAEGDVYTPYGATEALPVASISASEVLGETAARSAQGAGTCVGRRFPGIQWRVIRIGDDPITHMTQAEALPPGEIGELVVRGPVVTGEYVTRVESNREQKIHDGESFWHRMGDVGYLDDQDRFWFCGRKAHRVLSETGVLFTIPCEAIFNQHAKVYRSALVGVGPRGAQRPVILVETWPEHRPKSKLERETLLAELAELGQAHEHTRPIRDFLLHPSLPVDIRHNAKIFREKLAPWAARRLAAGAKW